MYDNLSKLFKRLRRLSKGILVSDLWCIRGTEICSEDHLEIAYMGNETQKNYIARLAFGDEFEEIYLGRRKFWEVRSIIKSNCYHCSLFIIEGGYLHRKIYGKESDYFIPIWINSEVDIPLSISSKSAREDIRKIRKNKLDFAVANSRSDYEMFYYNMYEPYIISRYGDRACLLKFGDITKAFSRGETELLIINKEGEPIAGQLILFVRNQPRLWALGIGNNYRSHLKDGAVGAAYYFSSLFLEKRGYTRMHLGSSRAFLDDGVLQFKKKWGIRVISHPVIGATRGFMIKPLCLTRGSKGFLFNNPFIYVRKGEFHGAIFVEDLLSCSSKKLEKWYRDYFLDGTSRLVINGLDESDNQTMESALPALSDTIILDSNKLAF